MPTGYTYSVQDGSITTLKEFALLCARAFGACIMQRDDPITDLPKLNVANTQYYENLLKILREDLLSLQSMSEKDANIEAQKSFQDKMKDWLQRKSDRKLHRERYEAMRRQVQGWTPPTPGHQSLQNFMLNQLTESIEFDTNGKYDTEPTLKSGKDWLHSQLEYTIQSIARYEQLIKEEIERTNQRNKWISELYTSLNALVPGNV